MLKSKKNGNLKQFSNEFIFRFVLMLNVIWKNSKLRKYQTEINLIKIKFILWIRASQKLVCKPSF